MYQHTVKARSNWHSFVAPDATVILAMGFIVVLLPLGIIGLISSPSVIGIGIVGVVGIWLLIRLALRVQSLGLRERPDSHTGPSSTPVDPETKPVQPSSQSISD